jgi:O-acetyl-ADP-ribose deacetylase (regulator of RNase III)
VDGAIHRAAGPGLLAECRSLRGCPTGEAKITGGYRLKARFVIHAVGPVWRGGDCEELLLTRCYKRALDLTREHGVRTLALPCISTGAFGYPMDAAARVAVRSVATFLGTAALPERVTLCAFTVEATVALKFALNELVFEK